MKKIKYRGEIKVENFKKEIVMNALDSDAFKSTATAAGYINPEIWNKQVLRHVEDTIIVSAYAKVYDDILGAPGDTLNITINAAPTVAAAVAESDAVAIKAYAVTQVVFTPTEYGEAYQLTDKQARRGFYSVAQDMTKKIGYSLALLRDTNALSTITDGAGNSVVANGVVASDIASTDTIDYDDIVNAMTAIRKDKLVPRVLIVSPGQLADLMKNAAFRDASQFGGRETVLGGELKQIAGIKVVWSTLIESDGDSSKAVMLGYDLSGESPFGMARKALPTIRTERDELFRTTNFVGVEEWDYAVLRANGLCTLESYEL